MAISAKDFVNYAGKLQKAGCTGVCWDFAIGFNRILLRQSPASIKKPDLVRTFNFDINLYTIYSWDTGFANGFAVGDLLVFVWSVDYGRYEKYTQRHFAIALGDRLFGAANSPLLCVNHEEDYVYSPAFAWKFDDNPLPAADRPYTNFVRIESAGVDGFLGNFT